MNLLYRIIRYPAAYWACSLLLVLAVMSAAAWQANRHAEEDREIPLVKALGTYAATLDEGTVNSRAMGAAILFGLQNQEAKQLALGKLPPDAPVVSSALDTLRTLYLADSVFLVDAHGVISAYSSKDHVHGSGRDLSALPCVQLAMHGTPNVYPVVDGNGSDRGIYLAAPVRAGMAIGSGAIGVVIVKVGSDKLDALLDSWTDGIAMLLSPQGVVFAASRKDWLFRMAGEASINRIADIRRTRHFGRVFDSAAPLSLPFTLDMQEAGIDDTRYAVRSLPLSWNDPEGDWVLLLLERRGHWWSNWSVLGITGLAGLIATLAFFWIYTLARNALLLENMNVQLRRNDELLKESQIIAGLGSYTLDIPADLWKSSDVLDRLFGIDSAYERSVEGWAALIHPDDRTMMVNYFRDEVLGKGKLFDKEYRIIRYGDHAERWVLGLGKLELDTQGQPLQLHGTIQDITERKQSEKEIRKSMRQLEEKELAKTRFLAAAGHDLRQPLAAANLFIDALKTTAPTPQQDAIIRHLDQSMSTFNGLLDALLNVSKLDAGMIKPEYISINVPEIFNWLEQNFSPLAIEKQIGFRLHFPMKEQLVVKADIGLLNSVFMNLVSNAIKFTARGAILISARRRGNDVLFQVWDTGIGIGDENISYIFDEFYQINNPQRDRTRGLGLGLSIAQRAISLLGGEITCRSKIEHGSVFEFRLPLDESPNRTTQQLASETSQKDAVNVLFARGKRFVVVEDDTLVAQAMTNLLEGMGGEVHRFYSAEDALRHANIRFADYFISDYMLGGTLNGIQLLNMLRQGLGKSIKAVLITGDTSTNILHNAENLDWPILHKPINASSLISALSSQE